MRLYRPHNKRELVEQIAGTGFRERRKIANLPKRVLWGIRADMIRWLNAREWSYGAVVRDLGRGV